MTTRSHYYTDILIHEGYGYLPQLWAAKKSAIISYEPGVSAVLGADGRAQTTHTDASKLLFGQTQDWKTLWWMFTEDTEKMFATVLPSKDTVDMKKLSEYFNIHEVQLEHSLKKSTRLPRLHSPGTSGPWTPKSDSTIDSIVVDATAFNQSEKYQHTSWAFPGIHKSKVYIPDIKHTLCSLQKHTAVPVYFADIRKQ